MSSSSESVGKTLIVAFLVCLCCAIVVSAAAVVLAPAQDANRLKDRQMNILAAAGLYDPSESLESQFAAVETRVVDLNAGTYTDQFDPQTFDSLAAAGRLDAVQQHGGVRAAGSAENWSQRKLRYGLYRE